MILELAYKKLTNEDNDRRSKQIEEKVDMLKLEFETLEEEYMHEEEDPVSESEIE